MTGQALWNRLRQRDVRLEATGNRLIVNAPEGMLTSDLRETLRSHKSELLAILRRESAAAELTPADLPADWRVEWKERAAVREYDGGQAREHAEAEALGEIIARMRTAGAY